MELELKLPKDINQVKLGDYQKYMKIIEANPEADNDFLDIKLLEIFCGITYADIQKVPLIAFNDALEYMSLIFESKLPLVRKFTLEGTDGVEVEFGLMPNFDKMTIGEYIDLNNYFTDVDNLHKAMAVLYRPVVTRYIGKENYRVVDYEGTDFFSKVMEDMPLGIALASRVFFYRLGMKLSNHILSYTHEQLKEAGEETSQHKALLNNTDGIITYMHSQMEKLSKSMKPLNYQFTKR